MRDTEKALRLTLKKQWFDMIASGEKPEEYREIKPYWVRRLVSITKIEDMDALIKMIAARIFFLPKEYKTVIAKNGYSKDAPTIKWEHKGIRIGTGKPEWGAEPGKQYFILEIGTVTRLN